MRKFWSWPQTFPEINLCQWEHVLESSQRPLNSACTSQLWTSWRPMQRWLWVLNFIIRVFASIICIPFLSPCEMKSLQKKQCTQEWHRLEVAKGRPLLCHMSLLCGVTLFIYWHMTIVAACHTFRCHCPPVYILIFTDTCHCCMPHKYGMSLALLRLQHYTSR